jgi:hypothetical protein
VPGQEVLALPQRQPTLDLSAACGFAADLPMGGPCEAVNHLAARCWYVVNNGLELALQGRGRREMRKYVSRRLILYAALGWIRPSGQAIDDETGNTCPRVDQVVKPTRYLLEGVPHFAPFQRASITHRRFLSMIGQQVSHLGHQPVMVDAQPAAIFLVSFQFQCRQALRSAPAKS